MEIKIKATTTPKTDSIQALLVFDLKRHNFSFTHKDNDVTLITYDSGEVEVITSTIEQFV
jgi:hypothetical protein